MARAPTKNHHQVDCLAATEMARVEARSMNNNGGSAGCLEVVWSRSLGTRPDPCNDAAGIHRTGGLGDHAALRKQHARGNTTDPEFRHQLLLSVGVHLEEPKISRHTVLSLA